MNFTKNLIEGVRQLNPNSNQIAPEDKSTLSPTHHPALCLSSSYSTTLKYGCHSDSITSCALLRGQPSLLRE